MVYSDEVLLIYPGTLLDPEILAIVEVPGGGVANQLPAVSWPLNNAAFPEFLQTKKTFRV